MGIMICPIHGRSEFVEMCSHAAAQIEVGKKPSGHRFDILGHLLVCDACFNTLGFDRCVGLADIAGQSYAGDDPRWAIYDAAYDGIEDRTAYCLKCFAEIEQPNLPN